MSPRWRALTAGLAALGGRVVFELASGLFAGAPSGAVDQIALAVGALAVFALGGLAAARFAPSRRVAALSALGGTLVYALLYFLLFPPGDGALGEALRTLEAQLYLAYTFGGPALAAGAAWWVYAQRTETPVIAADDQASNQLG